MTTHLTYCSNYIDQFLRMVNSYHFTLMHVQISWSTPALTCLYTNYIKLNNYECITKCEISPYFSCLPPPRWLFDAQYYSNFNL